MMIFLTFTFWCSSAQERRKGFNVCRWNSSGKTCRKIKSADKIVSAFSVSAARWWVIVWYFYFYTCMMHSMRYSCARESLQFTTCSKIPDNTICVESTHIYWMPSAAKSFCKQDNCKLQHKSKNTAYSLQHYAALKPLYVEKVLLVLDSTSAVYHTLPFKVWGQQDI